MSKEIVWTYAWPLSTYYAAYLDLKKSVPHRTPAGQMENLLGLPYWVPEQRYLANIEDYIDAISQIPFDTFEVDDPDTGEPLLRFRVEKGKSAIYDGAVGNGMMLLEYSQFLMSYRKRDDGLLGIESLSKGVDTRLSIAEALKNPNKFPDENRVPRTNSADANFSNLVKLS